MSIVSGFIRFKDYVLKNGKYQLCTRLTRSDTVVMGDGTNLDDTVEKRITNLSKAQGITYDNTTSELTSSDVQGAIDELKKSVSDGKTAVAAAITEQGVATDSDASFDTMASNIASIQNVSSLPNLTKETTIDQSSDNTTPVIEGDQIYVSTNSDGVKRVEVRYTGKKGIIENNTLFGVVASKLGTATPSEVVTGYSFSSPSGIGVSGTMPNNGAWNKQFTNDDLWYAMENNVDMAQTIPKGYHSGGGKAYITAANLKKVKDAYYNNGYSAGQAAAGSGKYTVKTGTATFTGTNGAHSSEPAITTGLSNVVGFSMYGLGADLEAGGDNNQIAALVSWYSSGGTVYPSWRDNHSSNLTFTLHWVAWGS